MQRFIDPEGWRHAESDEGRSGCEVIRRQEGHGAHEGRGEESHPARPVAKAKASAPKTPAKGPAKAPAKATAKTSVKAQSKAPAKTAKPPLKSAPKPAVKSAVKTAKAPVRPKAPKAAPPAKATRAPAKATQAPAKTVAPPVAKKTLGAKPAGAAAAPVRKPPKEFDAKFLAEQRELLNEERAQYEQQAAALKAEADQLASEMEPGDIDFNEEGGEGDTVSIERERDLALAANARSVVEEIDRAIAKIPHGSYGICERCGQPIPKLRLKALPYAALCVSCKSGGLSARR